MSIAVLGSPSFVTCFELIGAIGYEKEDGESVAAALKQLVDEGEYKLVLIPERFAEATFLTREQVMKSGEITPVFALVPDFTMETGMRMEELQAVVSLAIGTKLEL